MQARHEGPLFDLVDRCLADTAEYQRFRAGALSRDSFSAFLEHMSPALVRAGVPREDVQYAKRYPASPAGFVDAVLADLVERRAIPHAQLDRASLRPRSIDHGGRITYIYPEEALLLAALAQITRPRRALFLGSYYGYWAHWALPAIIAAGGRAVLVDPAPAVQAIARRHLAASGFAHAVEIEPVEGQAYLAHTREAFDLVVIDAELPRDHADPDQRGKGVYRSLYAAAWPRLAPSALVVCHNILLSDHSGAPFFEEVIARNRVELGAFKELAERTLDGFVEYPSTEGVGIGWRHPR